MFERHRNLINECYFKFASVIYFSYVNIYSVFKYRKTKKSLLNGIKRKMDSIRSSFDKDKNVVEDEISTLFNNLSTTTISTTDCDTKNVDKTEDIDAIKKLKRNQIWNLMETKKLIKDYPPSCFNKIPNFKGCGAAAEKVCKLREFRNAKVVKINPSLAQMHLRFLTLRHQKTLLVPCPALTEQDFMYVIKPEKLKKFWQFKRASSKAGAKEYGQSLSLSSTVDNKLHIDLYVVASTVVSSNGVRLGKGLGYAELEWAILYSHGMVSDKTVVITTVHDRQALPATELPTSLMCRHDLPVDVIVTPSRVINVKKSGDGKLGKPSDGVLWDLLRDEQLENIPILKDLKPR